MLNPKPVTDLLKDFFKNDRYMRRLLRVALTIFFFFLLIYPPFHHMFRCYKGLNSSLFWGADVCEECKQIAIDSITKHDTFTITKTIPAPFAARKPPLTQTNKNGDNNAAGRDNNGVQGGHDNKNHVISGDHDTVGVNGDVNNYNGIQIRQIPESDIMRLMTASYPDRNIRIYFRDYNGADAEMGNVKQQIIDILKHNGYKNITDGWLWRGGAIAEPEKITFNPGIDGSLTIDIPHAK
jgi:hypothetical protein